MGFQKKTKHMEDENPGNRATILAAKFKNQYATSRFLVSVLVEFSTKLVEMFYEQSAKLKQRQAVQSNTDILSPELKKVIAKQVKREIAKYRKEIKVKPKT